MKPVVEKIRLKELKKSFNFFKVEKPYMEPFWHHHPEIELTYIVKGQGTRFVGNSILPYFENDLVLVGSHLPHTWVSLLDAKNEVQKAFVFQFSAEIFNQFPECQQFQNLFNEAEKGLHFMAPKPKLIRLIKKFSKISGPEQISALVQIIYQLYVDSNKNCLSTKIYNKGIDNEKNQNKIEKTTTYILENLNKKLTVNLMAERTNMVSQSFCRWFKNSIGLSFINYLNVARIEHACQLLMTTEMPIQEIAFDCGFESLSHFNRTFKKIKEKSPSEFRKVWPHKTLVKTIGG